MLVMSIVACVKVCKLKFLSYLFFANECYSQFFKMNLYKESQLSQISLRLTLQHKSSNQKIPLNDLIMFHQCYASANDPVVNN